MRIGSFAKMFVAGSLVSVVGCVADDDAGVGDDESQVAQDIVLGAPGSFNMFGSSMASGDLDGDGIDDLAVGVPGKGSGAVYLYKGTSGGLVAWRRINQIDVSPTNAAVGDEWGTSLLIEDIDGDGKQDLVVGAVRGRDVNIAPGHGGTVDVLWGASNNTGPTVSGSVRMSQKRLVASNGNEFNDDFGASLAVRRASNGATWLAIGAPGENNHTGYVHVVQFTGSTNRLPSIFSTIAPPSSVPSGGRFGASLVIRDLDNDGHRDVVVGAPGHGWTSADEPTKVKGHAYAFRGTGTAFGSAVELSQPTTGTSVGDEFGMAIAAGHFDTSKYPGHAGASDPFTMQLVISAPGYGPGAGRMYRFVPDFTGTTWTGMHGANGYVGEAGQFGGGEGPWGSEGSSALVTVDLDGDGLEDVVTSSPTASVGSASSAGKLVVFTSRTGLHEATSFNWTFGIDSTFGDIVSPSSGDGYGTSLAVGHFHSRSSADMDIAGGMPDKAITVPASDVDGGVEAGAFFTFTRTVAQPNVGWLPSKFYDEGIQ